MTLFGTTTAGEAVHRLTLRSDALQVALITWGAVVQDVRLAGVDRSLTIGSDRLADYEGDMRHHGSLIGPIVNRISTGEVTIAGIRYPLERNQDGAIHLHSGAQATHLRVWEVIDRGPAQATLRCCLPTGTCGLPGNREITVTYAVAGTTLSLEVTATTDAPTLFNLANHSYWNLDGAPTWAGHSLHIHADRYLPSTAQAFPTGEVAATAGSTHDFRAPRRIAPGDPPLDNNFCLSDGPRAVTQALILTGQSGVRMTVSTDQPGIQVYDGRAAVRPGGQVYEGLAIEAQYWPDAPTNPGFPSVLFGPDNPYTQRTEWQFSGG